MQAEGSISLLRPNPNPDPITGEPGSHPLATAAGAAVICAACAALGSMIGPLGIALGGAAGAVIGGLTGSVVGESMDPTVRDVSGADSVQSYARRGHPYGKYIPSYKATYEGKREQGSPIDSQMIDG